MSINHRKVRSNVPFQTIAVTMCILAGWAASSGSTVEFSFTGNVTEAYGPGAGDLPSSIVAGAFCSGYVSYTINGTADTNPDPNGGIYNFLANELAISLAIGNDTFTSGTNYQKTITVVNDSQQPVSDQLSYSSSEYLINGAVPPGNLQSRALSVGLNTTNLNALSSDALPADAPRMENFPIFPAAGYRTATCYCYRSNAFYYGFTVKIENILQPAKLSISRTGNQLQVRWPTNFFEYQLESATNLVSNLAGNWSAYPQLPTVTGSEFRVTVDSTNRMQFFRLHKILPD